MWLFVNYNSHILLVSNKNFCNMFYKLYLLGKSEIFSSKDIFEIRMNYNT